jgi:hypothetical protein
MPEVDPKNEAMLLNALHFYSDNCAPEDLHPDCPYSVPTSTGLGCAEECLDYLAIHEARDGPELGPEIGATPLRPHRSRQGPAKGAPAFDCGQIYIEQRDLPLDRRSPVALLRGLTDLLCQGPPEKPEDRPAAEQELLSLRDQLQAQGFAVENIVYQIIVPRIVATILGYVLVATVATELPDTLPSGQILDWIPLLADDPRPLSELRATLEAEGDAMSAFLGRLMNGAGKLHRWLQSLSLIDLASWATPTSNAFSVLDTSPPPAPSPLARWAYERFTETYLHNWAKESLELEWAYIKGRQTGSCHARYMAFRKCDRIEVASAIADADLDKSMSRDNDMIGKYVPSAKELLEKGDRRAAVALFDMACDLSPGSADAHNNRGFCRLPDDPALALRDFETARELRPSDPFVTAGNQMLALHKTHRNSAALKIAEDACGWNWSNARSATMWNFQSTSPELLTVDSLLYVAQLAALVAAEAGDPVAEAKWHGRSLQRSADCESGGPHS